MAGKMRSPNYPALSLPTALEAAERLWKAEKRTAVSHETAATSMGFKSLSGPARVAIGALRQYGLIDKAEKGHLRLSDLAVRLLHGSPDERLKAQTEAAISPHLFKTLGETHLDASESAIRSYLITKKGFAEDGARKAAKAFRDTITLAKPEASGYTRAENGQEHEDMTGSEAGQNIIIKDGSAGKPSDGVFVLNVPFAKGTISVQVRVTGDAISPAHLARVRKYLELAESEWNGGDA